jgi:predicted metal-dependent peptidase
MDIKVRHPDAGEEKRKQICQEQLADNRQELLVRWPFIGGIIMRMELVAVRDDRLKTACTDGNTVFVDIDFYSGLSRSERLFVLAHEVWHSVFLHFARKKWRDQNLFNAAADLEIHFALKHEKMREPWVLPCDESWEGLPAEEIYEKLLQDSRYKNFKEQKNSGGEEYSGSFDRHIYDDDTSGGDVQDLEAHAESSEFVVDDDYAPQIDSETAEKIRGRVISAAQQVERLKGDLPKNIKKLLDDLFAPAVPWQDLLKQFVSSCYGDKRRWLPPARRHVWHDLYLPSMYDEKISAVVAMDTSGSTTGDLPEFFSELTGLMKSFGRYEFTVIQCDAKIQKIEKFSDSAPLPADHKFEVKGFGGTDFRPVFEYVGKLPQAPELLIYVTDGLGDAPQTPPPSRVMWVLTAGGQVPAPWGKVIYLNQK